jgi:hypothetical protein
MGIIVLRAFALCNNLILEGLVLIMDNSKVNLLLEEIVKDYNFKITKVKKIEYKMDYEKISVVVAFNLN